MAVLPVEVRERDIITGTTVSINPMMMYSGLQQGLAMILDIIG